jgi:hypothetical protein
MLDSSRGIGPCIEIGNGVVIGVGLARYQENAGMDGLRRQRLQTHQSKNHEDSDLAVSWIHMNKEAQTNLIQFSKRVDSGNWPY